jgi:hypothetical protein
MKITLLQSVDLGPKGSPGLMLGRGQKACRAFVALQHSGQPRIKVGQPKPAKRRQV